MFGLFRRKTPLQRAEEAMAAGIGAAMSIEGVEPSFIVDRQITHLAATLSLALIPEKAEEFFQELPEILRERVESITEMQARIEAGLSNDE